MQVLAHRCNIKDSQQHGCARVASTMQGCSRHCILLGHTHKHTACCIHVGTYKWWTITS